MVMPSKISKTQQTREMQKMNNLNDTPNVMIFNAFMEKYYNAISDFENKYIVFCPPGANTEAKVIVESLTNPISMEFDFVQNVKGFVVLIVKFQEIHNDTKQCLAYARLYDPEEHQWLYQSIKPCLEWMALKIDLSAANMLFKKFIAQFQEAQSSSLPCVKSVFVNNILDHFLYVLDHAPTETVNLMDINAANTIFTGSIYNHYYFTLECNQDSLRLFITPPKHIVEYVIACNFNNIATDKIKYLLPVLQWFLKNVQNQYTAELQKAYVKLTGENYDTQQRS